jgi:NodT family efflux transporter outer membrane factor (OMF) lipoprotein
VPRWWSAYRCPQLDALVEEALEHSPSLAAARSNLRAAHEQLRSQIGQNALPTLDAGVDTSRQRALEFPGLPQESFLYNVFAADVQASYTFDFFGAALLADRALSHQVEQQAFELDAVRRALAANVVLATIDAASLEAQLEAAQRLADAAERRAAQSAARSSLGSASREERLTSEADAASASAQLPPLRARLLAVRHAQAVLLGRTPDQAPEPPPLEALHLPSEIPVAVASELLHQRPDILAAEAAVRAAADAAGAATASMFPSLTLAASYGRGGFDWSTFTSPAGAIWSAGALLTQPLFHGGALAARRRQYQASYEAAVSQYRQTVLAAFQNVADTLVALETDGETLALTRRAAVAAAGIRQDLEARHGLGSAPLFTALGARQQSESANLQLIRAQAAQLADSANLFQAMGQPAAASDERGPLASAAH